FLLVPHRLRRPARDETMPRPLSRRRPGPIDPPLLPPRDGPRLSPGKRSTLSRRRELRCFFLVPHRLRRPARDETMPRPLSRGPSARAQPEPAPGRDPGGLDPWGKPGPICPPLLPPNGGTPAFAGEAFTIIRRHEPLCFFLGQ